MIACSRSRFGAGNQSQSDFSRLRLRPATRGKAVGGDGNVSDPLLRQRGRQSRTNSPTPLSSHFCGAPALRFVLNAPDCLCDAASRTRIAEHTTETRVGFDCASTRVLPLQCFGTKRKRLDFASGGHHKADGCYHFAVG